eukprot:gb/GECH01001669.1/.p1 GENE.gb/GECH01001669.1/~~gb/GECH01001669.1/.p1  ORF type:complete len:374 (+),score=88.61 gb/GECH01001669.1/:1-1122(+)
MEQDSTPSLQAIRYTSDPSPSLYLLNQQLLPLKFHYDAVNSIQDGFDAIKEMRVRGAPAIAVAAALTVAVEVGKLRDSDSCPTEPNEARDLIIKQLDYLCNSRPTAVNLFKAADTLKEKIIHFTNSLNQTGKNGACSILNEYIRIAEQMQENDMKDNETIAMNGVKTIREKFGLKEGEKISILTHCNTGALATVAYGTALGIIRFLHKAGLLERVYATETRPYNQGARLTTFECIYEKIPVTLICDSAVSSLFQAGKVQAAIVGADRVCANGDTANKIGTYHIAVSAQYHNIPFYVAAPWTSIDTSLNSGNDIVIEQRSSKEITHSAQTKERIVAEGVDVWNPGFDVTPGTMIEAIITDRDVIHGPKYDIKDN